MWCVPVLDREYVERMENILTLYEAPLDEKNPVVCLDERPIVLHDEKRESLPMRSGKPLRVDYEYVRRGTANTFCIVEPKAGRHMVIATQHRKGQDFAPPHVRTQPNRTTSRGKFASHKERICKLGRRPLHTVVWRSAFIPPSVKRSFPSSMLW